MRRIPHPPRVCSAGIALVVSTACAGLLWGGGGELPAHASARQQDRGGAAAGSHADRLRELQREADALAREQRTILVDLRKLEVERQLRVEQLARIDGERRELQTQIEAAEARAAELSRAADDQLPGVEERLVHLYKLGRPGYWRLLLNADDLEAVGRAYRTAAALTAIDRARVTAYYATLDALAAERRTLQARADELSALHAEAARTRAALDAAVASRTAMVTSIDARRDLTAQLIGELDAAERRLQASIAEMDKAGAGSAAGSRPFDRELPWPAGGTVTRPFGRTGATGATAVRNGIELAVPEGQPVRAVHDGTVAFADQFAGYGNLVIVEHGGRSYSLYGYLGSVDVERGQRVAAGVRLGGSGRNPSGNPSLYFELRIDGTAVDPLQWLGGRPGTQ